MRGEVSQKFPLIAGDPLGSELSGFRVELIREYDRWKCFLFGFLGGYWLRIWWLELGTSGIFRFTSIAFY
jgi:hypothetical protein